MGVKAKSDPSIVFPEKRLLPVFLLFWLELGIFVCILFQDAPKVRQCLARPADAD